MFLRCSPGRTSHDVLRGRLELEPGQVAVALRHGPAPGLQQEGPPGFPVNVPHVGGADAVQPGFDAADDLIHQLLTVAEVVDQHIAADAETFGQAPEGELREGLVHKVVQDGGQQLCLAFRACWAGHKTIIGSAPCPPRPMHPDPDGQTPESPEPCEFAGSFQRIRTSPAISISGTPPTKKRMFPGDAGSSAEAEDPAIRGPSKPARFLPLSDCGAGPGPSKSHAGPTLPVAARACPL